MKINATKSIFIVILGMEAQLKRNEVEDLSKYLKSLYADQLNTTVTGSKIKDDDSKDDIKKK